MTNFEAQHQRDHCVRLMKGLVAKLDHENRNEFTAAEDKEFNKLKSQLAAADEVLARPHTKEEPKVISTGNPNGGAEIAFHANGQAAAEWYDTKTGDAIAVLSVTDRLREHCSHCSPSGSPPLHLGRLLRGAITQRWSDDSIPEREFLAQAGGINSAGGVLVPEVLATDFIDLARAKTVCLRAGAKTIPMTSDNLTIARVTTDPVFTVKGENAPFSGTQVGFDGIGLYPVVIGNYIPVSRELIEDAPNASELLQQTLTKALAVAIDSYAINGTGSAQPIGLLTQPNIAETGTVGTLAWSHLQTAVTGIRNSNIEPNAYLVSPTTQNRLASLTTGDGTNAAKNWLPPPSNVAAVDQFSTTTMPDGFIIAGDFTELLFGVRTEARIEVSTEAGTAFAAHQVWIKVFTRWCCNVARLGAFHRLTGISG